MPQESQLWSRIIAALSGDTYVAPFQQVEDPNLSDWDLTAKRRARDEKVRRLRLGLDPERQGGTIVDQFQEDDPVKKYLSDLSSGAEAAPRNGGINVDPLSSYEFPKEGEPSGRATDKIDLPEQRQATADDGSYPYDYDPKEYLRDYASNMDPDKLARIRAQAGAKGRQGSLEGGQATGEDYLRSLFKGGGSFSQQEMSPELAQRDAERNQFISDQDMRDARWDKDLARQRQDSAGVQSASDTILNLKSQGSIDRRNQMLEAIVGDVGASGKIPYAKAVQLRQLGLPVDVSMIGTNPDDASGYFTSLQREAGTYLSSIDPIEAQVNPAVKKRAEAEKVLAMLAKEYQDKISMGYDPDQAMAEYQSVSMQYIMANGLNNLVNMQAVQNPQAGE